MTIPATNTQLLVAEDWKKIYQSFRNSDFKSYDFDTLRRTMISYLQENYPEDFNDFIDSSEYIALIDLIAYLGQNLSFRIDLNARENFLETAQRRDSILRLAQLISYSPTRNVPASGFLKVTAISTTDNVVDSAGVNLSNTTVGWNDSSNPSWYPQFIAIMNSAMSGSYTFGKPQDRNTIGGILSEQYHINSTNTDIPVYSFLRNINGTAMNFEIVPASFSGKDVIYESSPKPGSAFSLIYQNDNRGSSSANTGFLVHFRQGVLSFSDFSIEQPVPNEIIGVNTTDINDTDVWLWQINANGTYPSEPWVKVDDLVGNNIIYNSLSKAQRDIYSITSRDRDQIDLNFTDGVFGNLPKGNFKLFYRQSNGLSYVIKPEQMSGIKVDIPYSNKSGQSHVLSLILTLQYTVNNSAGAESNASIQSKAPQNYYIQNRMVTAEDYNIAPLKLGSDILKVKSVNRVSSGLSKYYDLTDITGKYSKTNIFASDGILYQKSSVEQFEFDYANRNEIFAVIKQQIEPIVSSSAIHSFYLDQYDRPISPENVSWVQATKTSGQSTGYFKLNTAPTLLGPYSSNNLKYITPGSMVKFEPPKVNNKQQYFKPNGMIVPTVGKDTTDYLWATIVQVIGDGSNNGAGIFTDGTGPVILSNSIASSAIPKEIIPKFNTNFSYAFETELVNLCLIHRNFGLSFDRQLRTWTIISDTNLNLSKPFNLVNQNDTSNTNLDTSWLVAFEWSKNKYNVKYRILDYVFESANETSFFIDTASVNYDFISNTVVKDQIAVLSINPSDKLNATSLGKDYQWQIDGAIIEPDGYMEPKKVKVSFYNTNGSITDPDAFNNIVNTNQFIFFKTSPTGLTYSLTDAEIYSYSNESDVPFRDASNDSDPHYVDGALYYFYDLDIIKSYDRTSRAWVYGLYTNTSGVTVDSSQYTAYLGRSDLKFHYIHNSSEDRRLDPSKSNIIDIYLLTAAYDISYRTWLLTQSGAEPLPPTIQSLAQTFGNSLESIKTISDEIIFQPVKYKVLFGKSANVNLQATFKAVKNASRTVSDNELKTKILNAIQNFFLLENWEFGQTFYFSELATYVMNLLTPDITNFVIVPVASNNFGSLYEIACLSNEIFINGAGVENIEIIDAITASQLKTTNILTNSGN